MARLQCKKCTNVFETGLLNMLSVHVGPYHLMKCPACGKRSWFNLYSSVKLPITWPVPEKKQTIQKSFVDEEYEKKHIEDSKYEKNWDEHAT